MRPIARPVPLALCVLLACGSGSSTDDDGLQTDVATTQASADEGTAPNCKEFRSTDESGPPVTIAIRHTGTTPVYFDPHGCGGSIGFEVIQLPEGTPAPYILEHCGPSLCDDFMAADSCSPSCPDCGVPSSGRFDAGGIGQDVWPGTWLVPLEMPAGCASGAACDSTCQRRDTAPAGRYQIGLQVFRTCSGTCECDGPSESGVCLLSGGSQLGYPITFAVEIDYPEQTAAEIVMTD